ncbi:hypothetical protein LFX25_14205 [Leptospira sp. FAT2]|uniref:hypothetical protein n=1 Tax=Leptospira sanjuanensis TaxID=2879643 RepID=UPI001EE8CECC|nr:hypothetical protein [Leptospira sanjuanensis]MCG6194397.1 hypothetical protein [Leptospira sanjuanensis]
MRVPAFGAKEGCARFVRVPTNESPSDLKTANFQRTSAGVPTNVLFRSTVAR